MIKVGVFDSGMGGLTVLRELVLNFPSAEFIYLGDTARLPYGTKSPETIRSYSVQIMNFLVHQNVNAIVIACNTASSQVPETEWQGIPVFNVIDPGAEAAIRASSSKKIGVLGTRATILSDSYAKKIKQRDHQAQVFSQSCPLLVPLAEEGWVTDPITDLIVARYLEPLLKNKIDTLILGCTHYPILRESIQNKCGVEIHIVDSAKAITEKMQKIVPEFDKRPSATRVHFFATDLSAHTQILAESILAPVKVDRFEVVQL